MPKGVFLDRDGTIIEDRGHLRDPSQVVFFPEAFEALRRLQDEFLLFIVTNQTGIARGTISFEDAEAVNAHVVARLAEAGVRITEVYICPHERQDGCECIKPRPHFLHRAAAQYGVDLRQSFTVGDHPHDVELGSAVDGQGIYVLTGHGHKHLSELAPHAPVARDIAQAAERILTLSRFQDEISRGNADLCRGAALLREGGVVAFPTETVYGLGASALNARAVARVFEIKQRPRFDPLIVHVCSIDQARQVADTFPDVATELARRFWPGPLTIVLPKSAAIPDIVTSGLPSVAVRMPAHPLALALISLACQPIAAPSANTFGDISPTTSEHVRKHLGAKVDMVLDGGPCSIGVESTILSLVGDAPVLLRPGGTPIEELEHVLGPILRPGKDPTRPTAPGQYPRHYAPRTPLVLVDAGADLPVRPRSGLLALSLPQNAGRFEAVELLSQVGNLNEAAANLFAALHRLDALGLDVIIAVKVPKTGQIGRASCRERV